MPHKISFLHRHALLLFVAAAPLVAIAFVAPPYQFQRSTRLSVSSSTVYLDSLRVNAKASADVELEQDSAVSTATEASTPPAAPAKIQIDKFDSVDAFLTAIDTAPPDSLVVVKYYSTSCPLCKRVALKYKKLARYYSTAPIRFCEMPKTATTAPLFATDTITTFPYLQIYRNGQCVASHGTQSASMFERIVNDSIFRFLAMSPEDWYQFLTSYGAMIQKATDHVQTLRDS